MKAITIKRAAAGLSLAFFLTPVASVVKGAEPQVSDAYRVGFGSDLVPWALIGIHSTQAGEP